VLKRWVPLLVLATGLVLAAVPAGAIPTGPEVWIGIAGEYAVQVTDQGNVGPGPQEGVLRWWIPVDPDAPDWVGPDGSDADSLPDYTVDNWSVLLKDDPFVTNNYLVTNTGASTATFIATVLLPITSFTYNAVINSSVGVTATDSDGNGTLLFDNDSTTPIYQGGVDFPLTTLLSLNPSTPGTLPITTADCPVAFPGCTATSAAGTAFLAVPSGTTSLIGIILTFELSAGDSAGITSRFEIANVPEPTTFALLGVGLVALEIARRRRH